MIELTPIKETIIQNDQLIHLRTIPNCLQPFINSLEKPPKIICKCVEHISLNQLNETGNRPIKILSTANLLTFIEYDLPDFVLPLSSLELLKLVNIYAYNAIQALISLHNLCVMPDIFFKELNDSDLHTNYNNTVNFINEYVNQQRELLDLEFPPKEPDSAYKNIIDSHDLHRFLENEIMEIKNLSKINEIVLDFSFHEKILQDLCLNSCIADKHNSKSQHPTIQEDTPDEYKFVNLFKIPFLNTDKILCVNIQHFNQLKFKCGVHNKSLFLNNKEFNKWTDNNSIKVFVPLKVVFRENSLLFTEVLDINEDVGRILLKRVSSGDRILCDLEYSTLPFDMSMFGTGITEDSLHEESNQNSDATCSSKNTEASSDTTDTETDTQINPIVRLPDNLDLRAPLKLHLNCHIPLETSVLHGKVVEILEDCNPYDVLLADLKIKKENHRYKTEFDFSVPDHDFLKEKNFEGTSFDEASEYFKALNKSNIGDNTSLVNNTGLLTITIDPFTCTDIDDAVSLRSLEITEELYERLTETLKALNEASSSSYSDGYLNGYSKHQTLLLLNGTESIQAFSPSKQAPLIFPVKQAHPIPPSKKAPEGGFYEIFIHIADCSAFISSNSELDLSASIKGTSFYYETATETSKRVDMLPSILSSNFISLRAGLLRRALSVKILVYELKGHFLIIDYEFLNDTVVNKCKLSYETAELIIKGEYSCLSCSPHSFNPLTNEKKLFVETDTCVECVQREFGLTTAYTTKNVASALNFLMSFTRTLKSNRGLSVLETILGPHQKDTDFLEGLTPPVDSLNKNPSINDSTHSLVEELMLLANQLAAIRIYTKSPQQTILRVHKPTEFSNLEVLKRDILNEVPKRDISDETLKRETLKREIMKRMNQAKYRNTTHLLLNKDRLNNTPFQTHIEIISDTKSASIDAKKKLKSTPTCRHRDSPFYHFGLNIPIYTHFTSPIRRYADLLVHRVILSSLSHSNSGEKRVSKEVINNLNRQTMKGKILNRISKQIRFVELKSSGNFLGIIERGITERGITKGELKIFNLSFLENESSFLKDGSPEDLSFYTKVYLPAEEIEGYISTPEIHEFPAFSVIRVKVAEFKGNEILFTLSDEE